MENQMKELSSNQEKRSNTGRPSVPPNLFAEEKAKPVSKKKFVLMTGLFMFVSLFILFYPHQINVKTEGKTVPSTIYSVDTAIAGKVIEVNASEGSEVQSGTLILKLANEKLSMEIGEALKEKEINNARIEKLVEEKKAQEKEVRKSKVYYEVGGISRAEENEAEQKLFFILKDIAITYKEKDKIEAKLQYLQSLKKKEEIRAPIDGVILTPLKDQLGKFLPEGQEAFRLGGRELVIECSVSEEQAQLAVVGSTATLLFSAMPLKTYSGSVMKIDSKVEEETEKVWIKKNVVRVTIGISETVVLTPGMKVQVLIDTQKKECLVQGLVRGLFV